MLCFIPRVAGAFLLALTLALAAFMPARAQDQAKVAALVSALDLMRGEEWDAALAAAGPDGSVARDIIQWHRLRASLGTFADTRSFLARRSDWPGLKLLRKRSEETIPAGADPQQVLAYFAGEPPQTGWGVLRQAEALRATGAGEEAAAQAVQGWRSLSLEPEEEAAFLAAYGDALKPHDWARLDMLLWRGAAGEAERMLPRVGPAHQALARARIGLRRKVNGVDALIAAVPDTLADDPGLAYERFLWRATKGRNQDAADLLLKRSESDALLGDPDRWSGWRRVLARWSMRDGQNRQAYRLAAGHHLSGGGDFNDLEWLAGYIALRKLNDPATALRHFQTFRQSVETPISLGRAGYWEGRAYEALGDPEAALAAYSFGAEFQTSFYGQLAAEKAGLEMDPALTGGETFADFTGAGFWSSSVMQAARLVQAADELYLTNRFTMQLAESLNRTEIGQLTAWAESVGEPNVQVVIAKHGVREGTLVVRPYFPTPDIGPGNRNVPRALELAIARRESEFNPEAVSGVGARGLMQLMPDTAGDMAARVEVAYSLDRLVSDPAYNTRLGSEYLAYLIEEFGRNPVLIAVAYNAGPSRARSWSGRLGHPADRGVDVIDWIEHIPFRETRNYVMRVTESLPIYRARLTGKTAPPRLSQELKLR